MKNISAVPKQKNLPTLGIGTALMLISGSTFAEGDLAAGAVEAISGGSGTLQTVGITIIGVIAGIWVIKRVIGLIRS